MRFKLVISTIATITFAINAQVNTQCVFNDTHCGCAISTVSTGLCTRYSSGSSTAATCYVDDCEPNKYICDCTGSELCEISPCGSWGADTAVNVTQLGLSVACTFQENSGNCLKSLFSNPLPSPSPSPEPEALPLPSVPATPSPTTFPASTSISPTPSTSTIPTPSPFIENRMVMFGLASDETMFNMSFFTDTNNFITNVYNMRNAWPQRSYLEHRWHTVMFFQNHAGNDWFLCWVMNTYNAGDDNLGNMEADVTINGLADQDMRWVACDGVGESCQSSPGSVLTSYFANVGYVTDGFCIKPFDFGGDGLTIQLANVQGAKGIRFINPTQTVAEFLWSDGPGNGMTGTVGTNGLVTNGSSPVIMLNLAGLPVP